MIKKEAAKISQEKKEEGAGILSRTFSTMFSGYSVYKKYYSMPVEQIVSENPGNYCIDAGTLEKIEVKNQRIQRDGRHYDETEIQIKAAGGKYSFKLSNDGIGATDARSLLASAYPGKVK